LSRRPARLPGLAAAAWFVCAAALAEPIAVDAQRVPFNSDDLAQTRAGALVWIAGLSLSAPDPRFGGWSGMVLSPDGRSLVAVSDTGAWLTATLTHDSAGRVTGLAGGEIDPLLDPNGQALKIKRLADAEALARDRDGSLLVAFEGAHRIWRYAPGARPQTARATPVSVPPRLREAPRNGGIEAMAVLADGRLVALTEDMTDAAGNRIGWLRDAQGWHEIAYASTGQFKPTDLTQLPDGDLLVLERRFTMIGGVAARLQRLPLAGLQPGARLEGEEVAQLIPPVNVDNMEALAAVRASDGSTLIYLLSDDNFNPLQRTLLLQFRLVEAR